MDLKIKIITGILAVGVILISNQVLSKQNQTLIEKINTSNRGVIVTTDKTEYEQGEIIKITIRNNLNESIYSHIGSSTPIYSIDHIEKERSNGTWEKLFAQCRCPHCIEKIGAPKEIKPGQSKVFRWKPLIYLNGTSKAVQPEIGTYRIAILYQIRKGSTPENWKWHAVYSNKFTIKKK